MDIMFLLFLQDFREAIGGVLNDFFLQISDLSYGIFIWTLACIMFWAVDKKTGSFLFLNIGFSRFFMQLLKLTFCVYRPWIRCEKIVPVEEASGYSFPSGHSVTASSNYGTIIERYRKYKPLCILMGFMILLTMFSRNYIGVHTPQDVIVGALLGLIIVIIGSKVWKWIDKNPKRDYIIPCIGIVFTALFLVYISLKSYPMDYAGGNLLVDPNKMMIDGFKDAGRFLGVTIAWFIERRFVKFSLNVSAIRKVTRCCFGVLMIMIYENALMPAVTSVAGSLWASFALTFFELILLIVIYPLCFSKLESLKKAK